MRSDTKPGQKPGDAVFKSRPDEIGSEGEIQDLINQSGWDSGKEFEYKGYGDQGAFGQPSGADYREKDSQQTPTEQGKPKTQTAAKRRTRHRK
jgi:hypothetical protein